MRRVALLGLLVPVMLLGCQAKKPEASSDEAARHVAAFDRFAERITRMRNDAATGGEETACPDEVISRAAGARRPTLAVAEWEALEPFSVRGKDPYAGERKRFERLTTPRLRALSPPVPGATDEVVVDALFKAQKLEADYSHLGVLRVEKLEMPRLDGDQFVAGSYAGWLSIFELSSGKRQCLARVEAASSGELVGTSKQARDRVMWKDFVGNVREAVHAATRRVSQVLVVVLE